jgi:hypothetical protein
MSDLPGEPGDRDIGMSELNENCDKDAHAEELATPPETKMPTSQTSASPILSNNVTELPEAVAFFRDSPPRQNFTCNGSEHVFIRNDGLVKANSHYANV